MMTVGAISTSTGISNVGCAKEGNLIQCKQLNCDRLQLWNSSVALQLNYRCKAGYRVGSGARSLSGYSACLGPFARGTQSLVFGGKGKCVI